MKNARLLITVITNLLDEAIIVGLIIFGLPRLGVHIPLWGTVLICLGFVIYAVLFYRIGNTVLMKRPLPGFSDMIGIEGKTVNRLSPAGFVKLGSELWDARTEDRPIEAGIKIIVIKQEGLRLIVRPKN